MDCAVWYNQGALQYRHMSNIASQVNGNSTVYSIFA